MTTVAIITDIHMRGAYRNDILCTLEDVQSRIIEEHDPEHTFVLGDLIQDVGRETDRRHLRTVASVLESGHAPVTYLLGNHDTGSLSREEVSDILGQDSFYGRVTVGNYSFVYLNSSQERYGVRGVLGPEQRSWFRGAIPGQSIVLSHHPIGPFSLANNVWFQDFPERALLWDRKELLEILDEDTIATLSGHIHQTERTTFRGLSHISINAFSKEHPDNPISGTYAVLSLEDPLQLTVYREDMRICSYRLQ
ncbi:metallophosphoesterase family protein [Halopenitus persicus]|uniref:metallophosphoesterase family protein n=1 Tax=Halopenitus persicus TaxID=1048396 RepID=UPI000BBA6E98|nr:metallophosphoesterase [Halopenitus persicus]